MIPDIQKLVKNLETKLHTANLWNSTNDPLDSLLDVHGDFSIAPLLNPLANMGTVDVTRTPGSFRWRDCEPLLEQASALLDRALADRETFRIVGEKYANLLLDLTRTITSISISDDEQLGGQFTTPHQISYQQLSAQRALLLSLSEQLNHKIKAQTDFSANTDDQGARAGFLAATGMPIQPVADPLNTHEESPNTNPFREDVPGYNPPSSGSPYRSRSALANTLSQQFDAHERMVRQSELDAEVELVKGQISSLTEGITGLEVQEAWDFKNQQYLSQRAQLEKLIKTLKLLLANIDGFLNFGQQLPSISLRLGQSVADAYERLKCVEKGMHNVYGWVLDPKRPHYPDAPSYPLPTVPWVPSIEPSSPGSLTTSVTSLDQSLDPLDALVAWTRQTATWLAALTRQCHNYVLPISVKAMVSERWSNGLGTKSWQFNLGKEHFAGECYIRIRGIVGWVVGGDDSLWTLKVHLPDMPTMIYPTGWTTNPDSAQDVKDFTLSCVTKRANRPNPDLSGITSCYNACPIGDWQIRIQNAFDESAQVHVDDVQMDLYLSVLPL